MKDMAGGINRIKAEIRDSNTGTGAPESALSHTGRGLPTFSPHPAVNRISCDPIEELPADNNTPLYTSRIISTYIVYPEEF